MPRDHPRRARGTQRSVSRAIDHDENRSRRGENDSPGGTMASKRGRRKASGGARSGPASDTARLNAILGDVDANPKVTDDLRARAQALQSGKARAGDDATELLCWAAGNGRAEVIATLLERGADPNGAASFTLAPYDPHDEDHEWTEADWFAE